MRIKDVAGYEDRYAVSDDGRVWSKISNRWLNPHYNDGGYLKVGLCRDGKRKKCFVHRLVCEAFHGEAPSPAHQVDHINGIHTDNRASNLQWVTVDENIELAAKIGIGYAKQPVVGFDRAGHIVEFESMSAARRSGFTNVRNSLASRDTLCHGYAFVFATEWPDIDPEAYFEWFDSLPPKTRGRPRKAR